MKKHAAWIALSLLVLLCGCEGFKHAIVQPIVTEVPGQYITNVTVTIFNGIRQTNYAISAMTTTNWVRNDSTFQIVEAAGSMVPGYGTLMAGLLGLIGTGYASYLNARNKRALVATIHGVEKFRNDIKTTGQKPLDDKLVEELEDAHYKAGVGPMMSDLVTKTTDK